MLENGLSIAGLLLCILALFLSHLFSFYRNFLHGGENHPIKPQSLLFAPYARITVLHLTIIFGAFASHADVKLVTIVDEDVDVHDPTAVEWAVATRFQASSDTIIVAGALGSKLDPSGKDGLVDKMGLDATKPIESEPLRYTVVNIPGEEDETLIEQWVD